MKLRRVFTFAFASLMALSLFILPASAAITHTHAADVLFQLGLFQGMGNNEDGTPDFNLDGLPTREQAVTMLVRLLGKEGDAKTMLYSSPFTDVADWAKPYVGYAYENGLTTGTSDTTFSGQSAATAAQYLTFVLRALGYSSESDFAWDKAYLLSHELGITEPGQYENTSAPFTRGDVAFISACALEASLKNEEGTLLTFLNNAGVFKYSKVVVLDVAQINVKKDTMEFAFYPMEGSPNGNTYKSFKLDKVTINGLPCKITQHQTNMASIGALKDLETLCPTVFNYSVISYDEEAALKAATVSYTTDGQIYPILVFSFEGTGSLPSGETVKESFSEAFYIKGYA